MNAETKKRYKDMDFPFTCPISYREFNKPQGLSCYVTKTLKLNHEEYYDTYIHHRDKSCFFCGDIGKFISISKGYRNLCNNNTCLKKSFSSHSIEGFMYRNVCSREEAEIQFGIENKRQLEERIKTQNNRRKEDPLWDKKRSRNCKEFWLNKGYSEEESIIKSSDVMSEIHKKTSIKLKSNPEKYASKYPSKIEYYLKRELTENFAKKEISRIQNRFSLDICIEKYGEEEGTTVFKNRQDKWLNTMDSKTDEEKIEINRKKMFNNSGYSKISQKLFHDIYVNFNLNEIKFEELNGEVIRYDKINKRHYRYDYVDFTKKKVIEYNGDFWHCNPLTHNENHVHIITNKTAKDLWHLDKIKSEWMIKRGYQVLTVWDSEYRKYPQQTLEKCIRFINE